MARKITTFDILKDIITIKSGDLHERNEFGKVFNSFMILRYLSMHSNRGIKEIANRANTFATSIDKEQLYKFLITAVPQNRNSFIKYIKKTGVKNGKK